jgi:hypothetical protein
LAVALVKKLVIAAAASVFAGGVLFGLWKVAQLAESRNAAVEGARAATATLQRCLERNMAPDISGLAWQAIQQACEVTSGGQRNAIAECILTSRDAVVADETTAIALQACGFSPD